MNGNGKCENQENLPTDNSNEIDKFTEVSDKESSLPSRLSELSLKESEDRSSKALSSDDDKFESDQEYSPRLETRFASDTNGERSDGVSLNLKVQSEMSFQAPTLCGPGSSDMMDAYRSPPEPPTEEALLDVFSEEERLALSKIQTPYDPEDLLLFAKLHKKGYLHGEHHLEEIMYMENLTRSQLMQILDKFKDMLITFEAEDPAVAMLYP